MLKKIKISRQSVAHALLLITPMLFYWIFNRLNMPLQFSLVMGAIALPFLIKKNSRKPTLRFAAFAIACSVLLFVTRSGTIYFIMSVFVLFYIIEQLFGRINYLPLLLLIVVAPAFSNIVYVWSFPIRLHLTFLAAETLKLGKVAIEVSGNLIHMDGNSFSVDPACIGLNTIVTALTIGILILGFYSKKHNLILPFWQASSLLFILLLLAVFSNFIRLLMLIIFHILPENILHDVVGIMCLILYVLLPFTIIIHHIFKRKIALNGLQGLNAPIVETGLTRRHYAVLTILFTLQIVNGLPFLKPMISNVDALQKIEISGYQRNITDNCVLKLKNENALIYVKPPVNFYQGSHDPRYCWQGSGYNFTEMRLDSLGNELIYTALLVKDDAKIYTAWWYQNKRGRTPHEWDWRWSSLFGNGDFYMINLNCNSRQELDKLLQMPLIDIN